MRLTRIASRLLQLLPVLLGVVTVVFLIMRLTPGDPVEIMLGQAGAISEEEIERLRRELGLDRPIHLQYLSYLGAVLRGDFGRSIVLNRGEPVIEVLGSRLGATVELTLLALIVSLLIALPAGVIAAIKRNSLLDHIGTISSLIGASVPGFWLGILLILLFSVQMGWLPTGGRLPAGASLEPITGLYLIDALWYGDLALFWEVLAHLALPAVTLGTAMAAITMRVTRSSLLDVLSQDYIMTAASKGLPRRAVIVKHALKNALIPTVTVVMLNLGILLGGNMVVEVVFGWPGMGELVIRAIQQRDYPLVQGAVFLYALTYVAANFLADVLYTFLNPQVEL